MKPAPKFTFGYTLIEILVALTIVGLIFGIGYVGFRDFSRRQALSGTARSIKGDLRLTQEDALSGRKPGDGLIGPCAKDKTLNGYGFRVTASNKYSVEAVCTGGSFETKSITLPTGITVSTPTPNPIIFKTLGLGTNIVATTTLDLVQTATGNTAVITISSSGEIK